MNSAPSAIVKVESMCKSYRMGREDVSVLKDVSMEMLEGEFVAVMGQSGSGKSTLLNILGCLDVPTRGAYRFREKDISLLSESDLSGLRAAHIGFVFQNFCLLPKLTLEKNIELPLIYAGIERKARKRKVCEALERFGLSHRAGHLPSEVSGGQKQRAAIARALIRDPDLILADEPTGNLDSTTTQEILGIFEGLHAKGHSILMITHESEVASHAARTVLLKDGRICV